MSGVALLGRVFLDFLASIGAISIFSGKIIKSFFRFKFYWKQIVRQMLFVGYYSLPVVGLTAIFTGAVLALQSYTGFSRFNAESSIASVVVLSITRELGPVLAGLMLAGRVGAAIAAEVGTMKVTEQIDAMEVSAINPFKYLVVTRVIATTMILPILTIYVIFLSIIGGFIALTISQGMNFEYYKNAVVTSVTFGDLIPSISKTFVFGYIVGIVGSYKGYIADGGTEGVGRASTTAVVLASLIILLFDTVLVKISLMIWPL